MATFPSVLSILFLLSSTSAFAAKPSAASPVIKTEATTVRGTITRINYANRELVLRGSDGRTVTSIVPEEITRFHALRIGDALTAVYRKSVTLALRDPRAAGGKGEVRTDDGEQPAGMIIRQSDQEVTAQAVNLRAPSITVSTREGQLLTFNPENPNQLAGVKPGDVIRIIYTESVSMTVDAPRAN